MALFERADAGKKVTWVSVIGLILVPLIIAAGFVFATWKVSDRMGEVKAAIVNDDDGAKIQGQQVPLGRMLVSGLMDDDTDGNYKWSLADVDSAEAGLKSGEYVAVVHIPKGFSRAVATGTKDDPSEAVQATISVTSSKVSPLSDSMISQSIDNAARDKFNREWAEQVLDGIYVGFNDMGKQFKTLADAGNKLHDGADGLADGNKEFAKGVGKLGDGVGQLGTAGAKLGDAGSQLAAGAPQLKAGGDQLAKGAKQLGDAGGKIAKGVPQLTKGGKALADNGEKLGKGGKDLAKEAPKLKKGGAELSKNGSKLSGGLQQTADGVKEYTDGVGQFQKGIKTKGDNLKKIPSLAILKSQGLVGGEKGLISEDQADEVEAQCKGDASCEAIYLKGIASGMQGDSELAKPLAENGDKVADGIGQLAPGVKKYTDGVSQYTDGVGKMADGVAKYGTGVAQYTDGVAQYTDGVGKFADGAAQYGTGVGKFSDGVGKYTKGVGTFADGVSQFGSGVSQYTGGVVKLSAQMPQMTKGADKLADGTEKYADGVGKFADGLDEGKDSVPHYSKSDRETLKEVTAAPIKVGSLDSLNKFPIASSIALLLVMALFLGALIAYTVLRPVSAASLTSRKRSFVIMLKGLLPGLGIAVVQSLGLTILCQVLLKLNTVDFVSLLGFTVFAGIVFTVVNFALVALFGGAGRFIGVILLVLGVTAKILTAVPGWLSGLAGISPLTPAIDGVAAVVTGADGLGKAFGLLLVWLVLGAVAGIAAVAKKRSAGFEQIQRLAHA
jgi:putative membrane protein